MLHNEARKLLIQALERSHNVREVDQLVAVLFAENAALLSILPEEAVPAICRAGSMVADTVDRDGQNFFHR